MKFHITGVDKSTGKDRQLVIQAPDEDTAVSLAKFQGVFASSAQHVLEEPPSDSPNEQPNIVYDGVIRGTALTLALVGAIFALASTSGLWLLLTAFGFVILLVYTNWDTLTQEYKALFKTLQEVGQRSSRSIASQHVSDADEGMPLRKKLALGFGLGIPAICFLMFITYWFGFRGTWEINNFSQITDRCEAINRAVAKPDDAEATRAYNELFRFIGDHQIKHDFVADHIQAAQEAYAPVKTRIELKLEAEELAKRQRREVQAKQSQRHRQQARNAAAATPRSARMYKGFTESELERVYEALQRQGHSSEDAILTIEAMTEYPDTKDKMRRFLDDD